MSFTYSYHPKVAQPHLRNDIPQMESGGFQTPFYFGGSQVLDNIPSLQKEMGKKLNGRNSSSTKVIEPGIMKTKHNMVYFNK